MTDFRPAKWIIIACLITGITYLAT